MYSLNRVQLIGNIVRDPEMKQSQNNNFFGVMTIATNHSYKSKNGDVVENSEFHNIIFFGKLAEIVEKICSKGKKVFCEGRLQTRKWQNSDGENRYSTEIVLENLIVLSSKNDEKNDFENNKSKSKMAKEVFEDDQELLDDLVF